jgi:hypothetical protein
MGRPRREELKRPRATLRNDLPRLLAIAAQGNFLLYSVRIYGKGRFFEADFFATQEAPERIAAYSAATVAHDRAKYLLTIA